MKVAQNMSIIFWLRSAKNNDELATIMVRVTINGKRADWSLGKKVNPDFWITGAGQIKSAVKESKQINSYLNQIRGDLQNHYNILLSSNDSLTPEMVKNSFLGISSNPITAMSLLLAFEIHNRKSLEKVNADKLSKKTWVRLEIAKQKISLFLKLEMKCKDIQLNNLKKSFITNFEHFLSTKQHLKLNTVVKYLKILKQVINFSVTQDWLPNNLFNFHRCNFKSPERIVLNQHELSLLINTQMPKNCLEQVKDIFLFCCYTGFAYSDVKSLSKDFLVQGIDGEMWIHKNRNKTDVKESVMLLDIPLSLILKYENHNYCIIHDRLLPVISNQKFNLYIREVASICKIKKHLTSHIARHTFATTVTLANGVSLESVSAMLGHASIKTTQIYAKVVQSKLSNEMKDLKSKMNSSNSENLAKVR